MEKIIWLIFAHFIGDVALQNDWQAQNKGKFWYVMFGHCVIWTASISVALQFLGIFAIWKVLFLLVGHWVCDKWKTTKPQNLEGAKYIYLDQAGHFIQILIVFIF